MLPRRSPQLGLRQDVEDVAQFESALFAAHGRQRFDAELQRCNGKAVGEFDPGAYLLDGDVCCGAQKPVITHLHKSGGQDVLEKPVNEFNNPERSGKRVRPAKLQKVSISIQWHDFAGVRSVFESGVRLSNVSLRA